MSQPDPFQTLVDALRRTLTVTPPPPPIITSPSPASAVTTVDTVISPSPPVYASPMAKPAPYSGSAEDCSGFLLQCELNETTHHCCKPYCCWYLAYSGCAPRLRVSRQLHLWCPLPATPSQDLSISDYLPDQLHNWQTPQPLAIDRPMAWAVAFVHSSLKAGASVPDSSESGGFLPGTLAKWPWCGALKQLGPQTSMPCRFLKKAIHERREARLMFSHSLDGGRGSAEKTGSGSRATLEGGQSARAPALQAVGESQLVRCIASSTARSELFQASERRRRRSVSKSSEEKRCRH
ncbi:hypothetical protein DPX16_23693 [Anabarilius grahami]|uniref:Uncharacterized protein n=1 Tax=Anabarilius grahami TaxID=495550 RepID=A0A3N0XUF4_ANAGA|nr:hypothetical protein DPX16_23693 [Anabarilius grahami]